METEPEHAPSQPRVRASRGLSTVTAAVVMIVVIIVVGAGAYVAFAAAGPQSKTLTTCTPKSAAVCAQLSNAHDLTVLAPFKSAQTGNAVPFTALLPAGESSTSYTFDFGDGSKKVTQSGSTADHTFTNPGTFIVQVSATVGGALHDNLHALTIVTIAASSANPQAGNLPGVSGTVVSNSTSTSAPSTILQPGGKVTVKGTYTTAPTNPAFALAAPTISTSSGGSVSGLVNSSASAQATVTFATAGTYIVNFVGSAKSGTTVVNQNYTWTVVVAPSGVHAGTAGSAVTTSPHKGSLIIYEEAPGGAQSLDPAIAYDTVSYEPILNVYQGLIQYNGSSSGPDPGNYVPVLATCVPGTPQCLKQWGNPLWTSGSSNWTFTIDPNAQFYDPHTGAHWGVYPSDVVFSVARTMGFADLPCAGCHNGWILTQSLLPAGNPAWDTALVGYGMHAPYNNTPQNIFASMSVNDTSAGCPAAAMTKAHGCVTFHANGLGQPWPYFLELIGDQLGASIVPCGWFSAPAQGAGIPGWTTMAPTAITGSGDHPCLLPGGATSTTSPSFINAVNAMAPTAWDTWEGAGSGTTNGGGSVGTVIGAMAGSGPYYLSDYRVGTSYALKANPDYKANPQCTWTNCEPAPGQYASNVQVTWESTATPGEQAFASGSADFASIPAVDTALAIQLIQKGKIAATSYPSISIFFHPFDMNFSVSGAQKFIPEPINVPGDFFNYLGMRQFLVHSYPYATIQSNVNTKLGIQFGFSYGGVIPNFMGNYYPANITWPSGDPCTANTPNCATYWWNQITSPSSPYYDPETKACTSAHPCTFPNFGENGAPDEDQRIALWDNEITSLSHGALVPRAVDINFIDLVINSLFSSPGTNPMPLFTLGWAPDYPDPTDYIGPMWAADSTYTFGDSVLESLSAFNATGCPTDFHVYAAMTTTLPQKCEGAAYTAMQNAIAQAAVAPAGPGRVWLYNQVERIGNQLALYQYSIQTNQVWYYASWVNGATINQNIVIGGGGDSTWWSVGGNGVF